jgi:hypothetical protein
MGTNSTGTTMGTIHGTPTFHSVHNCGYHPWQFNITVGNQHSGHSSMATSKHCKAPANNTRSKFIHVLTELWAILNNTVGTIHGHRTVGTQ